jgi:hypothetical protein
VLRVPALAWLLGTGRLFGYHLVYFTAPRLLPRVEARLIINPWPLQIILLTALIPGERLLPRPSGMDPERRRVGGGPLRGPRRVVSPGADGIECGRGCVRVFPGFESLN